MTVPTKIQRLLDSRQLETIEVPDADVAALWQKAVTRRDATLRQLFGERARDEVAVQRATTTA
jgi:hypothetical protein